MAFNPASTLRRHRATFVVVLVLCAAIFAGTAVMQARALTSEQVHAQSRTRAIANEIDGRLDVVSLQVPLDAMTRDQLDTRLNHALADEDVMAVRVWTPGGTLRYSSLPHDRSGPLTEALSTSTKGLGRLNSIVDGEVMTTYAPLRAGANGAPFGAVEVQQPYGPVLAAASQPWSSIRALAATAGAAMVLVLAWGLLGALPARRAAREGAGFGGSGRVVANDDLRGELEAAWASLEEAEAAREVAEHEWARAQARSEELDHQLAKERVDATGAGERLVHARERIVELEASLEGAEKAPAPALPDDQRVAGLEAALEAALERARSAEDLAAAYQDRLTQLDTGATSASAWSLPADAPEEVVSAGAEEAEDGGEDDAGGTGLRGRLARTAARRRAKRREDDEWP
jgi:hypothetical protein